MDIDINIVDDLTPIEFYIMCKSKKKLIENQMKDKYDLMVINAYHTACFNKTKKLKDIKRYLTKRQSKRLTNEELLTKVMAINTQLSK